MTMSSGPAAGPLGAREGPRAGGMAPLAGREGLTTAGGFPGGSDVVPGSGGLTALARAAAGFLGDAATFGGFPGPVESPPARGFAAFPGTAESPPARGFADSPGTVESPPARGFPDFGGGFGDGSDPDGVERFLAIYLWGA